jgi:YHS domain-containing protein
VRKTVESPENRPGTQKGLFQKKKKNAVLNSMSGLTYVFKRQELKLKFHHNPKQVHKGGDISGRYPQTPK